MTTSLIAVGGPPFLSASGAPLSGGLIYFFEAGTSTPRTMHKDRALTLAHTHPIVLDSAGWPPGNAIWTNTIVDMDIRTSGDVSLRTIDEVSGDLASSSDASNPNYLINGGFQVAQDGAGPFTTATTPANSDGTYLFDQWILLSEGNDIVDVSRVSTAGKKEPASAYALDFEVVTFDRKFGIIQWLDNERTKALHAEGTGVVSLSFTVVGAETTLTRCKAAILAWDGVADSPTLDVVASWGADGVTPTFLSTVDVENTISEVTVSQQLQRVKIEGVALDTVGTTNLAIFIWSDDRVTASGSDRMYLSAIKLEAGYVATDYVEALFTLDYYDAVFFYWKRIRGATNEGLGAGGCISGTTAEIYIQFPREMHRSAGVSVSAAGDFQVKSPTGGTDATTSVAVQATTKNSAVIQFGCGAVLTAGEAAMLQFDATVGGFISFNARL